MNYTEFCIVHEGKHSYHISLPCFSGGVGEYEEADRLNRFFSRAADSLTCYAESLLSESGVRAEYRCTSEVNLDGKITVTLFLSFHKRGEKTVRKSVSHTFDKGYAVIEQMHK